MYVPFIYVNDGVCDYELCCDGSEEYRHINGIKCENRCAQIGKEYRKLEDEKRSKLDRAGKKRKAMAQQAAELRAGVEARLTELVGEVARLESRRDDLQKAHAQAVLEDKGKVVRGEGEGGKLGVLVNLAKQRVNELRTTLGNIVEQRDELRREADELREILRKLKEEYNPNFNDAGVKAAVKSFEEYAARDAAETNENIPDSEVGEILQEDSETSGVNWKAFEELQQDDTEVCKSCPFAPFAIGIMQLTTGPVYNLEAYLPAFLRDILRQQLASLRKWLVQNGILADNSQPGSESQSVRSAREALEAAEKEVKSKKYDLEKQQADLDKDYGPSDIFRALSGKCVSVDSGEYTYELCWLDKTSQKSKKGHGNTNMGSFERIERAMADDEDRLDGKSLGKGERLVLHYEDGQQCWNGPRRRTDVWLACAETEELWRVSESEKCVYKMEVGTPAACELDETLQKPREKDEL
jgi:protein kinase C substrate 80K-H